MLGDELPNVLLTLVSNIPDAPKPVTPVKILVGKLMGSLHVYLVPTGTEFGSILKLALLQTVWACFEEITGTGLTITEIICSLEHPLAEMT